MKVSLNLKEGVSILTITGPVDMHNFTVLKAGITKLLRDGKNRIALDLAGTDTLDGEVIREVAILDLLARELAGRIALVVPNPTLKQNITSFSRPPIVPIFESEAQLLEFFRKSGKEEATEDVGTEDSKELKRLLKAKESEVSALQSQLKQLDTSEIQKLRDEAASAQAQYKELLKQMKEMLLERRKPSSDAIVLDKVKALESEVEDLTGRLRGLTKGAS